MHRYSDEFFSIEPNKSKQKRKYDIYVKDYLKKKNKIISIRELFKKSKIRMAKTSIDEYIEKYGEDEYIYHELGKYYNSIGDTETAKKFFEIVILSNYKNKYYSMYELARIYKEEENYEKAIEMFVEIIKSNHPDKCYAKFELSKCYYMINKLHKTVPILEDLINNDEPNKLFAFDMIAEYGVFYKNADIIRKNLDIVKDDLSENAIEVYEAIIEIVSDKIFEAKDRLEKINTNNREVKAKKLYNLALVYYDLDDYNKSVKSLEELVQIEKTSTYYSFLIEMYIKTNDYENAELCIQNAMEQGICDEDDMNLRYGNLYFIKQEYEKAIECYNKIVKKTRLVYRDSLYKKLCAYIKLGKYDEVMPCYKELKKYDINRRFEYLYPTYLVEILLGTKQDLPHPEPKFYAETLMVDYDKEKVLEHIKLHKMENETKRFHSVFSEDLDIEDVYNYALENLTEENFAFNNFMDNYTIHYPNVGSIKGEALNDIRVITIPNSNRIITIFPCRSGYKVKTNESEKVKQMSRIDKFNKKYDNKEK